MRDSGALSLAEDEEADGVDASGASAASASPAASGGDVNSPAVAMTRARGEFSNVQPAVVAVRPAGRGIGPSWLERPPSCRSRDEG